MRFVYFCILLCLLLPLGGWAQGPQKVSGTVQTEAGTPLPGATVIIKGTYTGNSTNEEGQF
jgi:iron complex outermembrane receptor protein